MADAVPERPACGICSDRAPAEFFLMPAGYVPVCGACVGGKWLPESRRLFVTFDEGWPLWLARQVHDA